jgi:DTW domain-containing protein YfiP
MENLWNQEKRKSAAVFPISNCQKENTPICKKPGGTKTAFLSFLDGAIRTAAAIFPQSRDLTRAAADGP